MIKKQIESHLEECPACHQIASPNGLVCPGCMLSRHGSDPIHHALQIRYWKQPKFRARNMLLFLDSFANLIIDLVPLKDTIIKVRAQVQLELEVLKLQGIKPRIYELTTQPITSKNDPQGTKQKVVRELYTDVAQEVNFECFYCGQKVDANFLCLDTVLPVHFTHSGIAHYKRVSFWRAARAAHAVVLTCFTCNSLKGIAEGTGVSYLRKMAQGSWEYLGGELKHAPQKSTKALPLFYEDNRSQAGITQQLRPGFENTLKALFHIYGLRVLCKCSHEASLLMASFDLPSKTLEFFCEKCRGTKMAWFAIRRTIERRKRNVANRTLFVAPKEADQEPDKLDVLLKSTLGHHLGKFVSEQKNLL